MFADKQNPDSRLMLTRLMMVFVTVIGSIWTWVSRPADSSSQNTAAARVGAIAPNMALQALDGKPVMLKALRGKAVVLNFWATWCPPCRAEMAALNQVQHTLADRGLVVLGVNQLEAAQTVTRFLQEQRLDFPVALDSFGAASQAYRVSALPTTYFIDRDGIIREVVFGGPMAQALIESKALSVLE